MKKLFIFIIAVAFSSSLFCQISSKNVQNLSRFTADKHIEAVVQYADEVNSKVSPLLTLFLGKVTNSEYLFKSAGPKESGLEQVLAFHNDGQNNFTMPVFIKTSSISSASNIIELNGGKSYAVSSDILTAEIPLSSIENLALSPEIIYIEPGTVCKPKIDMGRLETKVSQIHNGTGISRPYKGKGVVVGILDSGIDWNHADFKNASGSRIKYLWDMCGQGNPPSGYDYGSEYTKSNIDANQCLEEDKDDGGGHGTHVSATAAGNGGAISTYTGMAPESDIIFVKGFRNGPGFASTDVVNGCNYIFQKAQQLGEPAVINLSLGGHAGPHDGTSLYEQSMSTLTGNGKIIVAAAGNEGGSPIHLGYSVSGSSEAEASETFFETGYQSSSLIADMWYNGGNISTGLAAYDTSSLQLIGYIYGVAPGQKVEDLAFTVNGYTYGYVTVDATATNNPNNGANEVVILIDSHNGQVDIGAVYWSLFTFGSGSFDAWAIAGGVFSTFTQQWYKGGDNLKTIGTPGTSNKLICVGSYVTKDHWVDMDGQTRYQDGNPTLGKISWFSSLGPTRDNRTKPDIVAPGEVIIAALSTNLTQVLRQNVNLGTKHQKMQGTSMASPHVTGSVALLLEKNGTLNYDQVVTLLKNSAIKDNYTGNNPNNTYGWGKMDAYNAFLNTSGGGGGVQTAELVYDDGAPTGGYVWSGAGQGSAVRMTPTLTNAQLVKMEIWITGVNAGTATYRPIVLGSNGDQPGNDLVTLQSKTAGTYPGWDATDLSGYGIFVNGDFYVGLKYDGVNIPGFGYDQANNGRAWDYTTSWIPWNETYFMRATVQTTTTSVEVTDEIPAEFSMSQNYPNPFNPSCSFKIELPREQHVSIIIYDIKGEKVTELVNNDLKAGVYQVTWNGKNDEGRLVATGMYLYTMHAGNYFTSKKMMFIK